VSGDCHDGGIASFEFRQFRDGEMPEIMEAESPERRRGASPGGNRNPPPIAGFDGFLRSFSASAPTGLLHQRTSV
jgi:hypothetical protein